jgi:hypothetical protein
MARRQQGVDDDEMKEIKKDLSFNAIQRIRIRTSIFPFTLLPLAVMPPDSFPLLSKPKLAPTRKRQLDKKEKVKPLDTPPHLFPPPPLELRPAREPKQRGEPLPEAPAARGPVGFHVCEAGRADGEAGEVLWVEGSRSQYRA